MSRYRSMLQTCAALMWHHIMDMLPPHTLHMIHPYLLHVLGMPSCDLTRYILTCYILTCYIHIHYRGLVQVQTHFVAAIFNVNATLNIAYATLTYAYPLHSHTHICYIHLH